MLYSTSCGCNVKYIVCRPITKGRTGGQSCLACLLPSRVRRNVVNADKVNHDIVSQIIIIQLNVFDGYFLVFISSR